MNKKILIVDDTKSWLAFHTDLIHKQYGDIFEIETAESAGEAFNKIRHNIENPFSVIITDLQMENVFEPKLAGEWLIEHIKSMYKHTFFKIIIISAMYNLEYIARKHDVEFISKSSLVNNKLLMKYMFEKIMPFLDNL